MQCHPSFTLIEQTSPAHRHTNADRQTVTVTVTVTETDRDGQRQTDIQRQTDRQRETETDRNRQRDGQRQTETHRAREKERETHTHALLNPRPFIGAYDPTAAFHENRICLTAPYGILIPTVWHHLSREASVSKKKLPSTLHPPRTGCFMHFGGSGGIAGVDRSSFEGFLDYIMNFTKKRDLESSKRVSYGCWICYISPQRNDIRRFTGGNSTATPRIQATRKTGLPKL